MVIFIYFYDIKGVGLGSCKEGAEKSRGDEISY